MSILSRILRSRLAVAIAVVTTLVVATLLAPSVLTRLAVPKTVEVSWLLGTRIPHSLEFEPNSVADGGRELIELAGLLSAMRATQISGAASLGALDASASYRFRYGYKGPSMCVSSDGSVEMLIPKSDLRKKSFVGRLWAKFDRNVSESSPYVLYRTDPHPKVFALIESVYARSR